MTYECISFETEGSLAVVTLNRPNRRNALSLGLMLELLDCLGRIGNEKQLRAVVLGAAGKVYSSGHDLSELVGQDINDTRRIFDVCAELMTKIQSIPQPVIAEVQGVATAAGCQLVATCDLARGGRGGLVRDAGRPNGALLHDSDGRAFPRRRTEARPSHAPDRGAGRREDGGRVGARQPRRPRRATSGARRESSRRRSPRRAPSRSPSESRRSTRRSTSTSRRPTPTPRRSCP